MVIETQAGGSGGDAVLVHDTGSDGFTPGSDTIIAVLDGVAQSAVAIDTDVIVTP